LIYQSPNYKLSALDNSSLPAGLKLRKFSLDIITPRFEFNFTHVKLINVLDP